MTRWISPALAVVLFSLPVEAQQGDLPGHGKLTTDSLPPELELGPGTDSAAELEEVVEPEMEMEFCGGDEEGVVMDAYYTLQGGDAAEAEAMLVEALRAGEVEEWQRIDALMTLADAQLQLGKYWAAVRNYERALREEEATAGHAARVGLATALFLQHRRRVAVEAAREAEAGACASRFAQVECYAARLLVAQSTRDGQERSEAEAGALQLREAHADLAESFDAVDQRLGIARTVVVAAR